MSGLHGPWSPSSDPSTPMAIAAANARRLRLGNLLPVQADWLQAIAPERLDAIVSNPPYVPDDDPHLQRGDLRFEPRTSLAAGADGLDAIRSILDQAPSRLRPGGWIGIEHGWDQAAEVRRLLAQAGFEKVATHRDLAGHERVSSANKPGAE
jgi:release factor glutamine methyltransferase